MGRLVLALAMLVTGGVVMHIGRGTTFSGDEMVWIGSSPHLGLETLLTPHGGHLQFVPRLVYRGMLEVAGIDYWPYRLLTVFASWLTVGLLYTWLTRRVPRMVALAPCLVLLVFGADPLHVIQGNGFTILLSIAAGLGALLMLDRRDRAGDVAAALLLVLGVLTYSVALPFVVGAALIVLTEPGRRRRWWVPAVPILVYGAWWIGVRLTDIGTTGGVVSLSNVALIPSWVSQAVGVSADALAGPSFDFAAGDSNSFTFAAPLSLLVVAAVAFAFRRKEARRGLLVVIVIGCVLWALQALVSHPGLSGRLPSDQRYLLPGAVAVVLLLAEAARRVGWGPGLVIAVWLVALMGIGTNLKLLSAEAPAYRVQALAYKDNVGATSLMVDATGWPDRPRRELVQSPVGVIIAMTRLPWGQFGTDPEKLLSRSPEAREKLDSILTGAMNLHLDEAPARVGGCRRVTAGADGLSSGALPPGGAVVESPVKAEVRVGRLADVGTRVVGTLPPRQAMSLAIPSDGFARPWSVEAASPWLEICRIPES